MEYRITFLPRSEVEITSVIPFSEFQPHVESAARVISEAVEIPGFRPGRAPYDIVKNHVGEMKIYEEAADQAVRKTFPKILTELSEKTDNPITPIGKPEIVVTKLAPKNDFEYKARLAFLSRLDMPDYRDIARRLKKERKDVFVEDDEVEKTVQWILESRAPMVTVSRPAQKGDSVEIDFSVKREGVQIESGESKRHPLVIGQSRFLPGFDEELVGMRAGEQKEFVLAAPEDWHEKSFAGKPLDVAVTLHCVQEKRIPDLTDDFVKNLGNFSSVDSLRANIRDGIREEKENKEKQRIRMRIAEDIAEQTPLDIPEPLVQSELEKMAAELQSGLENMGMKWEDYLLHIKKGADDLKKDWRKDAEKRVRIALVLREIAERERIEPSAEEVLISAKKLLSQYQSLKGAHESIDQEKLKEYTFGIVRNEKVFEFLESV